ncbi:MAG TPA: hypothetical protein VK617_07950 [Gemmatimonadaceae bacterium]|nr:hypothetical protein [Gemmatimonadaceae bacterium]
MRRFYPQLLTVSAIAMAPGVFLRIIMRDKLSDPTTLISNRGAAFGAIALSAFCIAIADAVLIVAASEGYLEGKVDLARALTTGANRLFSVIGAVLLRYALIFMIFVALGMIAAIVIPTMALGKSSAGLTLVFVLLVPFVLWWTIYVALRTFAVANAVLLENLGPISALSRTWQLSKDSAWHIFLSLGLAWLLYLVIAVIANLIGAMLLSNTLTGILSAILIIPIYPLLAVVSTLLYYDLRIRKEGFDLEVMSRELGGAVAPLPAA